MAEELRIAVPGAGEVSALLHRPAATRAVLALGHGAGAGMRHPFMESLALALGACGIATLRYQFPYMERAGGGRRSGPDPAPVLTATVRAAVERAAREAGPLPLIAGGKSMGGRMTSLAAAHAPLPHVRGIVFFGFPLHPAGQSSDRRGEHLAHVEVPMLFLQGTRDALADLELLRPQCAGLGAKAMLHIVDGADHAFHVLKRSGRTDAAVLDELADTAAAWVDGLPAGAAVESSSRGRAAAARTASPGRAE